MAYLIKYAFKKKNRKVKSKHVQYDYRNYQPTIYHVNVNVNLMEENVIQTNGGITINVDVSIRTITCVKKDYVSNPTTCNRETENI